MHIQYPLGSNAKIWFSLNPDTHPEVALNNGRLTDDVVEWLTEQRINYGVYFMPEPGQHYMGSRIWFDDSTNGILFKMRWL